MSSENQQIPAIRFKGFTEAWEQRKFEEMLDKNDGVRRGPFGSSLKKEIFVENSDYVVYEQQNAIYDNYKTRYYISKEKFDELHKFSLKENDFIMSGAGTIGRISRVPKGIKPGVFNQALIRFRINSELTNPEYFLQFIRAENMQRKLTGANPGSAITNLVPMTEVKNWDIFVPAKAEQSKLGAFFNQLDNTIALHQRQLENLKERKNGYLNKMFPQDGDSTPKIRFSEFNGDWEQRKLGDVSPLIGGYAFKSGEFCDSGIPIIRISNILSNGNIGGKFVYYDEQEKNDKYFLPNGAVLLAMSGATTGKVAVLNNPDNLKFYQNQRVGYFSDLGIVDYDFISILVRSHLFINQLNSVLVAGAQPNVSSKEIDSFEFNIPNSIKEQQRIGIFFKQLDNNITLHQEKINYYHSIKKAILKRMFV